LFPYNYSLAWLAHTEGMPLMRPLVLEYPDDPNVVDMSAQYLWGPSMLVAPVTRGGATHWPVYLPPGGWYDFWTHERYDGGRWIEVGAPLERLPLLVRAGAIVPLGPSKQYLDEGDGPLSLLIYPDGESSFALYEDDGTSWDYEHGAYVLSTIRCEASATGLRLRLEATGGDYAGRPETRTVLAQVYLPTPPARVTLAGSGPIPHLQRRDQVGTTIPGWWHDGERFLWIGISQAHGPAEVEVHVETAL
jgi:hypothetical protein